MTTTTTPPRRARLSIDVSREAGLLHPSIVTGIVRTITHDMIAGKLGELPASEMHAVENQLRAIMAP